MNTSVGRAGYAAVPLHPGPPGTSYNTNSENPTGDREVIDLSSGLLFMAIG